MRRGIRTIIAVLGVVGIFLLIPGQASAAANARGSSSDDVFNFSIGPGGSYFNSNNLACQAPCDFDQYNMTITSTTSVHIHVLDCCIQGDNICVYAYGALRGCAASPASVEIQTPVLSTGTYTFYIGYQPPTPGGFPAGYDMSVTA